MLNTKQKPHALPSSHIINEFGEFDGKVCVHIFDLN